MQLRRVPAGQQAQQQPANAGVQLDPRIAALPITQQAFDLLSKWGVKINVKDPNNTGGGGFWNPADKSVTLNGTQSEAALHEYTHAWWDYVKEQLGQNFPAVKDQFVNAVRRLADDAQHPDKDIVRLAHDYVYGDTFPGMIDKNTGFINDYEMYAGLSSGTGGKLDRLPDYIKPYYQILFAGGTPPQQGVPPTQVPQQMQQQMRMPTQQVMGASTMMPQNTSAQAVPQQGNEFTPPLHTEGRNIVDATGKVVRLASTALGYGGGIPFGIWWQGHSIPGVLDSIKKNGFNSIRLPLNMQTFAQPNYQMNLGNLAVNHPELAVQGIQPVQVLDYFLNECANRGIGVILDMHGYGDGDFKPSIWYTHTQGANGPSQTNIVGLNDPNNVWTDSVNEQNYIQWWQAMAKRYGNHPAVIGADLLNEPHDKVTWGDGNVDTDWRAAAERIGGAIQQIAPNWLIVVEGMDADVNRGGTIGDAWWGGNLNKVAAAPVRLQNVVYSPHDYGPSVWGNWWLSDPAAMRELWEREWGYIARNNIAPIWVGEFGQPNLSAENGGGQQVRQMLDYLDEIGASWSYWIWDDGASSDTGGLMPGGDGKPLEPFPEKMEVLRPYMTITEGWGSGQQMPSKNGYTPNLMFKDEGRPGFPPPPYQGYQPVTPTTSTMSPMVPSAQTQQAQPTQPTDPDPVHQKQKEAEAAKNGQVAPTQTMVPPQTNTAPSQPTFAVPQQPSMMPKPMTPQPMAMPQTWSLSRKKSQPVMQPPQATYQPLPLATGMEQPEPIPSDISGGQFIPLSLEQQPQSLNWISRKGIENNINNIFGGP